MNRHIEGALNKLSDRKEGKRTSSPPAVKEIPSNFNLKKIGTIHTPYKNFAPYQPRENDEGEFIIEVEPAYEAGLNRLEEFSYIYVLYYLHRRSGKISLKARPPSDRSGSRIICFPFSPPAQSYRLERGQTGEKAGDNLLFLVWMPLTVRPCLISSRIFRNWTPRLMLITAG